MSHRAKHWLVQSANLKFGIMESIQGRNCMMCELLEFKLKNDFGLIDPVLCTCVFYIQAAYNFKLFDYAKPNF